MHPFVSERRDYEACPHRFALDPNKNDLAVCRLIREITDFPEVKCHVGKDVCGACCRAPWPSGKRMNTVVASVIYNRVDQAREGEIGEMMERQLAALKQSALDHLEVLPQQPASHIVPARTTLPCCYLGDPLDVSGTLPVLQCHHPSHVTTSEEQCRKCRDWAANPAPRRLPLSALVPRPADRRGPVVREWAVGITTAPRRQSTVGACVDSVVRAGFSRPHLFVDAGSEVPRHLQSLPGTWRDHRVGAWPNFYLGLLELTQTYPEADAFLMLQDDAYVYDADNLREYLEGVLWPDAEPCLVSLLSTSANMAQVPGWSVDPSAWWCGALAFVFPAEVARWLLLDERIFSYRQSDPAGGTSNIDSLIGEWAAAENIPIWYPVPSLVQHIGHTSTLWQGSGNWAARHAAYFAGDIETPFCAGATLADFPESEFPPLEEYEESFRQQRAAGERAMHSARAVICGLCRDVRPSLPRMTARIERLGTMFLDYQVVLFENDSSDGTLEFLQKWSSRNLRVQVLHESLGILRFAQSRNLDRARHMAQCRSRYHDRVCERFSDYDYVIVIDMDLRGGFSYEGLASTFGCDAWDFVGSNGILRWLSPTFPPTMTMRQYDRWALRHVGHAGPSDRYELDPTVYFRGEPLVPVWSCFGGVGVYTMAAFRAARYGGDDCEHVELHRGLRQAGYGRLFLNPSQIVLY